MTDLERDLQEILNQKNTYLLSGNIKSGITVMGISGNYTSDASATSNDIVLDKTAYVNGNKVIGDIYEVVSGSTFGKQGTGTDTSLVYDNGLNLSYTIEDDVVLRNGANFDLYNIQDKVINAIGLTSDKIKNGINILGVIGNYRGEVKLFTTETQMNADTNKHEGDLAIVYSNTWDNITDTTVFSSCIFPNRVSLPSTITSTISLGFSSILQSPTFTSTGRLTRTSFGIVFNTSNGSLIDIEYSGMGRSYSRTDGGSEIVDFGESIQWSSNLAWDSAIGYFMQVNNVYFGGLYEVKNNSGTLEYVHIAP